MAEMTSPVGQASGVPDDIRRRVSEDFGAQRAEEVYRYLLDRIPDGLPNGTRPRHLRCILHLAKGDRALLERYIELCLQDTRDVMLQAEYEVGPRLGLVRVRDFRKPFGRCEIPKPKSKDFRE